MSFSTSRGRKKKRNLKLKAAHTEKSAMATGRMEKTRSLKLEPEQGEKERITVMLVMASMASTHCAIRSKPKMTNMMW
jgi:hypothetical protein